MGTKGSKGSSLRDTQYHDGKDEDESESEDESEAERKAEEERKRKEAEKNTPPAAERGQGRIISNVPPGPMWSPCHGECCRGIRPHAHVPFDGRGVDGRGGRRKKTKHKKRGKKKSRRKLKKKSKRKKKRRVKFA
ncbi:hypothetical protein N9O88_00190 [bacterium]|nr:hypothetical protein [bacterium]